MIKATCVSAVINSNKFIKNTADRSRILTIAIALGIAYNVPIPSMRVDSADDFFNSQLSTGVRSDIGVWNDSAVINWKECIELVRKFWKIRYDTTYPEPIPTFLKASCFFESVFYVSRHFSAEQQEFFEKHNDEIIPITREVSGAIFADNHGKQVYMNNDEVVKEVVVASGLQ